MKKLKTILFVIMVGSPFVTPAQVSINEDNSPPDSSAMLHVKSTNKGLLIPRMTTVQRKGINSPADGLMVYDTDDSTFYFYKKNCWEKIGNGISEWKENGNIVYTFDSIGIGTNTPSALLEVHGTISQTGTGRSVFLGEGAGENNHMSSNLDNTALGYRALNKNTTGEHNTAAGDSALYMNTDGSNNTALGARALNSGNHIDNNTAAGRESLEGNHSGNHNTAVGAYALAGNDNGHYNTAAGDSALYGNLSGEMNTAYGASALKQNMDGSYNVAIGFKALWKNNNHFNTAVGYRSLNLSTGSENSTCGSYTLNELTTGNNNTVVGIDALMYLQSGDKNTAAGRWAGRFLYSGSGNVFIGFKAGYNASGSNKLLIENHTTDKPLIKGDFENNEIYFYGRVGIATSNPYEMLEVANPNTNGSHSGRMIVSDGKGPGRRALLFVSPNKDDSDTNARIEAFNYGSGTGCNLEINRIGKGKTLIMGDADIDGSVLVASSNSAVYSPQAGMIRWNSSVNDFEGYNGSQWVSFTRGNEGWGNSEDVQEDTLFMPFFASDRGTNYYFGQSVSLYGDNAVIGAPGQKIGNNSNQGCAFVIYHGSNLNWQQMAKLYASDGSADDRFGCSVSVHDSRDFSGLSAFVGAEGYDSDKGKVYVYKNNQPNWPLKVTLTASDGAAGDNFGHSVSLCDDYALVGAYKKTVDGYQEAGKVYVYYFDFYIANWAFLTSITAPDKEANDHFGISVALTYYNDYSNGISCYYAIIGANKKQVNGNYNQGKVYIFKIDGSSVTEEAELTAPDGASNDQFGYSVSIADKFAAIGAPYKTINGQLSLGKTYLFEKTSSGWSFRKGLVPSDGTAQDHFGSSVSIDNDWSDYYLVVGADNKSYQGYSNRGKAYVYALLTNPGQWEEKVRLTPSGNPVTNFGKSVAVYQGYILTGTNSDKFEAVYLYEQK